MGTQSKKKKSTASTKSIVDEIKRDTDLDANKLAIQPIFEGTTYTKMVVQQTDFINVTDSIGPTQSPS